MIVLPPPLVEFPVGVPPPGVLLQVVHQGVAHRVGEGRLFPPQDTLGEPVSFKGFAQEIFAHAVFVQLFLRIDGHDILHKVQVAEGHPGLQGVHRDAPVRPEHIVHMQLPEPLLRLLLEGPGVGGVVGVLVAEQLIGDLPGEDHPDIRALMDGPAYQEIGRASCRERVYVLV